MKPLSLIVGLLLCAGGASAALPQWYQDVHGSTADADWSQYQTYSTSYLGPNALPVPELYDGKVATNHLLELSPEIFWGYGDKTQSLSARFVWAVVPGKISISAWGTLAEHYQTTLAVRDARGSLEEDATGVEIPGDFYLSTSVSLLQETPIKPDLLLDIVLKTASSRTPHSARFMDTPGYWFSLTTGKSILVSSTLLDQVRLVANVGFLCYQTNTINQNDAPMYGLKVLLSTNKWTLETGIHGYNGWIDNGDKPLVLRAKLSYTTGRISLFSNVQHSLRDYPFKRLQTGLLVHF